MRKEQPETHDERNEAVGFIHSSDEAGEQRGGTLGGAGGAKGWNQGEFGSPKHAPDAETGERVPGGGPDTASDREKPQGATDRAAAPCHRGGPAERLSRTEKGRSPGNRRGTVGGVWGEAGRATAGPASPRAPGRVPSASRPAGEHPQAGRKDTTARGGRTGGQDPPEGSRGRAPDADLRGGVSRAQLRVPARTEGA